MSNQFAPAAIRLGWLRDSAQLYLPQIVSVRFIVTVKRKIIPKTKCEVAQLKW